jgi:hypothetical protein
MSTSTFSLIRLLQLQHQLQQYPSAGRGAGHGVLLRGAAGGDARGRLEARNSAERRYILPGPLRPATAAAAVAADKAGDTRSTVHSRFGAGSV